MTQGDEPASTSVEPGARFGGEPLPGHLVLVVGPGRSGTSAVTGALQELGIHVPPPLVGANRTNQRGFFETRWVVDFQRALLRRANTYEFHGDPAAYERLVESFTDEDRQTLAGWLATASRDRTQLVVKDPRSAWFGDLWGSAATATGLRTSYLTMLRHPAEVAASRTRYYSGHDGVEDRERPYAIGKVAGWVNVSLLNERETRGHARVFLRYSDLIADWRSAMATVRDGLGLTFDHDLATGGRHAVDDFITSDLRRVTSGWDSIDPPTALADLAEDVWTVMQQIADQGSDADTDDALGELSRRYRRLYADSALITQDAAFSEVDQVRDEVTERLTRKHERELARRSPVTRAKRAVRRAGRRVLGAGRDAEDTGPTPS